MPADEPIKFNFADFKIPEPTPEELAAYCEEDVLRDGEELQVFHNHDSGWWSMWAKSKFGWRKLGMGFNGVAIMHRH
jgi:hypothetical protein